MPVRQVQIKWKEKYNMMIYKIKLYLLDIKLKRLNKKYNKMLDKYKKEYLGI